MDCPPVFGITFSIKTSQTVTIFEIIKKFMLKCKQPVHDKGTFDSADTLLHKTLSQGHCRLRYLRLVMSKTNMLELHIYNLPPFSFS